MMANRDQRCDETHEREAREDRRFRPLERPVVTLGLVLPDPMKMSDEYAVGFTSG
jgi:hypothetical protein